MKNIKKVYNTGFAHSADPILQQIEEEVLKARKLLKIKRAIFFYGNANLIAKEAARIAKKYLNLKLKIENVVKQIRNYAYGTFRLCPISCIQYPVIFFFSPYPARLLPFLSHNVAHEMLHLKHALFCSSKVPYFVREVDRPYWEKAGYLTFSYEKYFKNIIDLVGIKNAHQIIWDYSERIRDYLVSKELLSVPQFVQPTRVWETSQAYTELSILRSNSASMDSLYKRHIALLDLGMRLKFLGKNEQRKILKALMKSDFTSHVKEISELFDNIQMPSDPSIFKGLVYSLDQIVSLTKVITTV
jgi:hypothetical protein